MMRNDVVSLYGSSQMPVLGLGTATVPYDGEATELAIRTALKLGYRHIDTAKIYGSETAVGRALEAEICKGMVTREEVFVTSKLWGSDHHDPVSGLKETLRNLRTDYLDMYLVHWPAKLRQGACNAIPHEEDFEELEMVTTWAGMEKCLELGLCKCIGVSNFSCRKIDQLLEYASIPPAVNQVEMHPMWRQKKLREFCWDRNIHVSAYSPLGAPRTVWGSMAIVDNPVMQSIAHKHNATPAQVALSWGFSKGASMITKSFNQQRMKENMDAIQVVLDDYDAYQIETLNERKIMRGDFLVNATTSPYKTIEDLWDDEI